MQWTSNPKLLDKFVFIIMGQKNVYYNFLSPLGDGDKSGQNQTFLNKNISFHNFHKLVFTNQE